MVVSAAIHVVVIGLLLSLKAPPRPTITYIDLDDGSEPAAPAQVYREPVRGGPVGGLRLVEPPPKPRAAEPVIAVAIPDGSAPAAPLRPVLDRLPADGHAAIEPRYGDGRVWVRVSDVLAGNLPAKREAKEMPNHVARVDSALADKIRLYMDTVPPDSFAVRQAPKWTTEIAGQTWGIDGKWIYLGPIKLPAAVLALLPLPSGNYELAQRNAQLQRMREDLMDAAWRAQSAVEFKRYVKELRERKEAEHQQRIPPDTTKRTPLIP